ncbi:MAG: stage II sporulation protein P [Clostridia bacterium]|nr:stage II sporulation protein P [Clostridia bacterium]
MQALPTPKKAGRAREAVSLEEGYGGGYRALLILLVACALLVAAFAVSTVWMQADGGWLSGGGAPLPGEQESEDESDAETDGPLSTEPPTEEMLPEGGTPIREADLSCLSLGKEYIHNETAYRPSVTELLLRELSRAGAERPTVLILHTHTSEAYLPKDTRLLTSPMGDLSYSDDPMLGVVAVGQRLGETLEKEGITVLHCTVMLDAPTQRGAYERAAETVKAYLERYPEICCVIDLHRDSVRDGEGAYLRTIATGTEEPTAQLLFVVGTDGNGTRFPHGWENNLALALQLRERLNADGRGLVRPVTLRNSSYNQELAPLSLLLEVGSDANSLEEAERAAILAGKAIAAILLGEAD